MILIYDKKINKVLCPKCRGIAHWNNNGDLECNEEDCGYIYYMFSESGELTFESIDKSKEPLQGELF